jgi:hypothetical protein
VQVTLGLERMEQLMKLCNKFMLRRTSTVLKALLPAKVEQVGPPMSLVLALDWLTNPSRVEHVSS